MRKLWDLNLFQLCLIILCQIEVDFRADDLTAQLIVNSVILCI